VTRPQVIVNVVAAIQRRGDTSDTGNAFMVYAGATGPSSPVDCYSMADATAAAVPAPFAQYVSDALTQGAPKVTVLRAAAVDASNVTQTEWTTALNKLTNDFGPGQVFIPGVATAAAHSALIAHANTYYRTVLLDTVSGTTAAAAQTLAAAQAAAPGSQYAMMLAGWSIFPVAGGTTRTVPPSVIAAGLLARNDAHYGHSGTAAAGDKGWGAGYVSGATGLVESFTETDRDTLNDSGVCAFRNLRGQVQLYGFVAVSSDPAWKQANWGRMAVLLHWGIRQAMEQYLFRQIDAQGKLFAQVAGNLLGYLQPFAQGSDPALVGDDTDVDTTSVNTPTTIAAGELHAAVEVKFTGHTEKIVIDVTVTTNQGA
jgi:hypothetical protein